MHQSWQKHSGGLVFIECFLIELGLFKTACYICIVETEYYQYI